MKTLLLINSTSISQIFHNLRFLSCELIVNYFIIFLVSHYFLNSYKGFLLLLKKHPPACARERYVYQLTI